MTVRMMVAAVLAASSALMGCSSGDWTYAEAPDEFGSPGLSIYTPSIEGRRTDGTNPRIMFSCFPTKEKLFGFIVTEPMEPGPDGAKRLLVRLQYDDEEPKLDTLLANGKGRYPTALSVNSDNLRKMLKSNELEVEYVAEGGEKRKMSYNLRGVAENLKRLEVGPCKEILEKVYAGER